MVVAKKSYKNSKYVVYGSHAMDTRRYEDYTDGREEKKSAPNKNPRKIVKERIKLIAMLLIMFCLSTLIVGRHSMIMKLNYQAQIGRAHV